jgi:hypothetical protein
MIQINAAARRLPPTMAHQLPQIIAVAARTRRQRITLARSHHYASLRQIGHAARRDAEKFGKRGDGNGVSCKHYRRNITYAHRIKLLQRTHA